MEQVRLLLNSVALCVVALPSFFTCMLFAQATESLTECLCHRANCKNFLQRKMRRMKLCFFLKGYINALASLISCNKKRIKTEYRTWWFTRTNNNNNNKHNQESSAPGVLT